jgi:hypothetical protein
MGSETKKSMSVMAKAKFLMAWVCSRRKAKMMMSAPIKGMNNVNDRMGNPPRACGAIINTLLSKTSAEC